MSTTEITGIQRDDTVHGETYFTAADMATAAAQGFREGQAAELAAMRAGGEPVAAPMVGEMALIAKALQRVGITNVLNHGAASCVFSQGCAGVSQGHLLAYTREIALQCAAALYTDPKPAAQDADRLDWLERAGPTSICLVMDRQHDGEIEVSPDDGPTGYGKTLRAAIDAAIAAQQGDSHE